MKRAVSLLSSLSRDLRGLEASLALTPLSTNRLPLAPPTARNGRECAAPATGAAGASRGLAAAAAGAAGAADPPSSAPPRFSVCVVGSGPSGFYLTEKLLKRYGSDVHISMIDRLPTPFGLVRFGVAPDHQDTKNVINQFTRTANEHDGKNFRFYGNVEVGRHVTLPELRSMFHAVVLACGAESDKPMGVPGEALGGVFSAREFVNWYNGHPHYRGLPIDLSKTEAVAVVGLGNVALDCARILLKSPASLRAESDIAPHALSALEGSRVKRVHLVGRRGPGQAAFTPKELREILKLPSLGVKIRSADLEGAGGAAKEAGAARSKARVVEILGKAAGGEGGGEGGKELHFEFFRSPSSVVGHGGAASALRVEETCLTEGGGAKGTGKMHDIPCGLVLRSIGYRPLPLEGLPFDEARGTAREMGGRAVGGGGEPVPGLYVTGWLRRGPSGIIGTNLADADEVAGAMAQDKEGGKIPNLSSPAPGPSSLPHLLQSRGAAPVTWPGFLKIDAEELRRGAAQGRPRVKITDLAEALGVAGVGAAGPVEAEVKGA